MPEGALVAGTPEGRVPRLADQEMPGQQIVLHGFFIDMFPYPNEEGAIPRTGVTQAEAEALCAWMICASGASTNTGRKLAREGICR